MKTEIDRQFDRLSELKGILCTDLIELKTKDDLLAIQREIQAMSVPGVDTNEFLNKRDLLLDIVTKRIENINTSSRFRFDKRLGIALLILAILTLASGLLFPKEINVKAQQEMQNK